MDNSYMMGVASPRKPVIKNPMVQSEGGDTIYLPKEMYQGKCENGKEVFVKAKVTSMGSKIGLTPMEIVDNISGDTEEDATENGW